MRGKLRKINASFGFKVSNRKNSREELEALANGLHEIAARLPTVNGSTVKVRLNEVSRCFKPHRHICFQLLEGRSTSLRSEMAEKIYFAASALFEQLNLTVHPLSVEVGE